MKDAEKFIDLTHTLSPNIPSWDGDCCFRTTIFFDYKQSTPPNLFRIQKLEGRAGVGTHIDAPAHCVPGGKTVDALDLNELCAPCVVIRAKNAEAGFIFRAESIVEFEREYGRIAAGTFVLFHSGWERLWSERDRYRNDLHFPSVGEDAAMLLMERGVVGIGIDTLSPDAGGTDYPVHRIILGAGKIIVENVTNVGKLPPVGAKILIMPMKIKDGTEAPVRLTAQISMKNE